MGAICVQLEYHTVVARTCYEDLVSIARAEAVHSRSLAMAFARSLYNLAVIYNAEEGHLSKAIASAEESIQVGILELVSTARADAVRSRSLAMAFARSLYNLAVIYNAEEGHLSKAIASAEESIQFGILESYLASRCLALIISIYLKMVILLRKLRCIK